MFQLCSNSWALVQQLHLPILFCQHKWFPTECKMSYWITWEGSNHLVFVNATIDHSGICPWRTMDRFHSLFHFQSFSKPLGVVSLCFIVTSVFLLMWLMWSFIPECVPVRLHDKEPLNMISKVLTMYTLIKIWNI